MGIPNFTEKFKTIKHHDPHRGFTDFYYTFDLDNLYTSSMIHLIMTGKRDAQNKNFVKFLDRCLTVYANNTQDYSKVTAENLRYALNEFEKKNSVHFTNDQLARYTRLNPGDISRALKGKGKLVASLWELVTLDLIPMERSADTLFTNLNSYYELQKRLMRAEIGNGKTILTSIEVAEKSGIDLEIIEHLDKACHSVKDYTDVYQKLVNLQQDYDLD